MGEHRAPGGMMGGQQNWGVHTTSTRGTSTDSARSGSSNVSRQSPTPRGVTCYKWVPRGVQAWGTRQGTVMSTHVTPHHSDHAQGIIETAARTGTATLSPLLLGIHCYATKAAHHLVGAFQIQGHAHKIARGILDSKGTAVLADAIDTSIPWWGLRDFAGTCRVTLAHTSLRNERGCGPRPRRVGARAGAPYLW